MGSSGLHGREHSRDRSGAGMFGGIEFIVVLRTVLPGWQMSKGDCIRVGNDSVITKTTSAIGPMNYNTQY